jgi:hypothetical protein
MSIKQVIDKTRFVAEIDYLVAFSNTGDINYLLAYAASKGKIPWEVVGPIDPDNPPRKEITDTVVQKAITESEVAAHLAKGAIFVAQLQNGTVIVETTIPTAKINALAAENIANMARGQIDAATVQLTKQAFAGNARLDIVGSSQDPIIP